MPPPLRRAGSWLSCGVSKIPLLLIAAGLSWPVSAQAQIPTDPVFTSRRTFREEHLERTYGETRAAMQRLLAAVDAKDNKAIRRLLTEDLLFAPLEGWLATGSAALDSVARFLPRVSGLGFTPLDFDASGSMAAVFGAVFYQLGSGTGRTAVTADATIVWVQRGRDWQVRSWVERPRARVD